MFFAVFCCALLATALSQPYPEPDSLENELVEISGDGASTGILELDPLAPERNMLHGVYLVDGEESDLQIELIAQIRGNEIVSVTTFHKVSMGVSIKMTSLRIPLKDLHHRKIKNMRKRIIEAAYEAVEVLRAQAKHFPPLMEVEKTYQEMADALYKATDELGRSQLRFSIMYHSVIVGAARRIAEGATEPDDICTVDPKYTYGNSFFICVQDLMDMLGIPPERLYDEMKEQFEPPGDSEIPEGKAPEPAEHRQKRTYHPRCCRWPPTGKHWGCCGNYRGRCWLALDSCWRHDCACQCCDRWYCGACGREGYCSYRRISC